MCCEISGLRVKDTKNRRDDDTYFPYKQKRKSDDILGGKVSNI